MKQTLSHCLKRNRLLSVYFWLKNFESDRGLIIWGRPVSFNFPVSLLSLQSDQHQFSPKDINTLSKDKVMRFNKMITWGKMLWSFINFSQLILWGNVWRSVRRICKWVSGLKGLKELCHEIYQNSNRGNCRQIEWNIKIIAQKSRRRYNWHDKYKRRLRMDKLDEDWNGLQLWFLKTCKPNSFSKFIFVVCIDWYNARDTNSVWHIAMI